MIVSAGGSTRFAVSSLNTLEQTTIVLPAWTVLQPLQAPNKTSTVLLCTTGARAPPAVRGCCIRRDWRLPVARHPLKQPAAFIRQIGALSAFASRRKHHSAREGVSD